MRNLYISPTSYTEFQGSDIVTPGPSSSSQSFSSISTAASMNSDGTAITMLCNDASRRNSDQEPVDHNFGNDYSDYYLRTGVLPQSNIRNIVEPLIGYPKLQRLHQLKLAHNLKYASKPYGRRIDPKHMPGELNNWISQAMNFDVVMINGCLDVVPSLNQLTVLPIQRLTPRPSIILLWLPNSALEVGRSALEHWGFRRSEDIIYFLTKGQNESLHYPKFGSLNSSEYIQKSTWHCLMGLKGTLRRSEDSDLINCNVDTDVILEKPNEQPNILPEEAYQIIENFSLMNRRLHIVPYHSTLDKPVKVRPGWVIMSPDVLLDNFNVQQYSNLANTVGYRVPVDPEIDSLRPKTPSKLRKSGV